MLLKGPEWTWSFADSASNPATDVGCPIFFTSEILVSRNGRSRDNSAHRHRREIFRWNPHRHPLLNAQNHEIRIRVGNFDGVELGVCSTPSLDIYGN